jgi:hypothetical protein
MISGTGYLLGKQTRNILLAMGIYTNVFLERKILMLEMVLPLSFHEMKRLLWPSS